MTTAEAKGLELPECVIPLCINGKAFRLYATPDLSDSLVALAEEAVRLSELTRDGKRSSVTAKFLARAIDDILGDGAVSGIFGEREPDVYALCDIITYIAAGFFDYGKMRIDRMAKIGGDGK